MSALEANRQRFADADTQVLGISVDSTAAKSAWANSLGGLSFDLLSDFHPHGEVAARYGILRPEGFSERALFLVDRSGRIAYARIYDIPAQPDVEPIFDLLRRLSRASAAQ